MHYFAGRGYEEIAEALQVPLGTVKTHLHRARQELREILESRMTPDPIDDYLERARLETASMVVPDGFTDRVMRAVRVQPSGLSVSICYRARLQAARSSSPARRCCPHRLKIRFRPARCSRSVCCGRGSTIRALRI
jgi:hypothetical protein